MSNYPSTASFGVPFEGFQPTGSSTQAVNLGDAYSEHPQSLTQNTPFHVMPINDPASAAQNPSFALDAQSSTLVPQQFHSDFSDALAHQGILTNALFPVLPFPQVPLPAPLWPPPFPVFSAMSALQPIGFQPPVVLPTSYPEVHEVAEVTDDFSYARGPDREEGELSDVEMPDIPSAAVAGNSETNEISEAGAETVSSRQATGHSHSLSKKSSRRGVEKTSVSKSGMGSSRLSPSRTLSDQERQRNEKSPADGPDKANATHVLKDDTSTSKALENSATLLPKPMDDERPVAANKLPHSMAHIRSLAKQAILDMLPHGIGFEQFLGEGISKAVLLDLFKELGLEVSLSADPKSKGHKSVSAPRDLGMARSDEAIGLLKDAAKEQPTVSMVTGLPAKASDAVPTSNPSNGAANVVTDLPQRLPTNGDAGQSTTAASSASPVVKTGSTSQTNGQPSTAIKADRPGVTPMERKDLILQKLAAKRAMMTAAKAVASQGVPPTKPADDPRPDAAAAGDGLRKTTPDVGPDNSSDPSRIPQKAPTATPLVNITVENELHDTNVLSDSGYLSVSPEKSLSASQATSQGDNLAASFKKASGPNLETAAAGVPPSSTPQLDPPSLPGSTAPSSASVLPGLFMKPLVPEPTEPAVNASSLQPIILLGATTTQPATRKRPIALDFDEDPPAVQGATKRPFGQRKREQSVVIDVSDDEESGDDNVPQPAAAEGHASPGHVAEAENAPSPQGNQKKVTMRDMPPLSDFPPARRVRSFKDGGTPTLTPGTPTVDPLSGGEKAVAEQNLKEAEERIRNMRREIAERELRKASRTKSRAQTPTKPGGLPLRSKPPTPPKPETLPTASTDDSVKLATPVQEDKAETNEAEEREAREREAREREAREREAREREAKEKEVKEMKAKLAEEAEKQRILQEKLEQRTQRRIEIQLGLTQTETEVEHEKQKLEEMEAECEKRKAWVQQALLKKQKLQEELRQLESEEPAILRDGPAPAIEVTERATNDSQSLPNAVAEIDLLTQDRCPANPAAPTQDTVTVVCEPPPTVPYPPTDQAPLGYGLDTVPQSLSDESASNDVSPSSPDDVVHLQDIGGDASPANTMGLDTTVVSNTEELVLNVCSESRSHELLAAHDVTTHMEIDSSPIADAQPASSAAAGLPLEDKEAEAMTMAKSPVANDIEIIEVVDITGSTTPSDGRLKEGEVAERSDDAEESDEYEPPEDMPPIAADGRGADSSSVAPPPTDDSVPFSPPPVGAVATPSLEVPVPAAAASRAVETGPEAAQSTAVAKINHEKEHRDIRKPSHGYYQPYESPLKRFRSYRFHPNFLQSVSQGYRSLTYSHKIDVTKPLCNFEARGGVCNDASCIAQHFRNMELSDDQVLVQMSTLNEGVSAEEQAKYKAGLTQALQELRAHKHKDFATVAARIAAYRSTFPPANARDVTLLRPGSQSRVAVA